MSYSNELARATLAWAKLGCKSPQPRFSGVIMVDVPAGEQTMPGEGGWQYGPVLESAEDIGTITSPDFSGAKASAFAPERMRNHLLRSGRRPILKRAGTAGTLRRPLTFHRTGQR